MMKNATECLLLGLFLTVCIINEVKAQDRSRSRYRPPSDEESYMSDDLRSEVAQVGRRVSSRRTRPTSAPSEPEYPSMEERKVLEHVRSRDESQRRRIPEQSHDLPAPYHENVPFSNPDRGEFTEPPPVAVEQNQQNKRRRPKKRRKPKTEPKEPESLPEISSADAVGRPQEDKFSFDPNSYNAFGGHQISNEESLPQGVPRSVQNQRTNSRSNDRPHGDHESSSQNERTSRHYRPEYSVNRLPVETADLPKVPREQPHVESHQKETHHSYQGTSIPNVQPDIYLPKYGVPDDRDASRLPLHVNDRLSDSRGNQRLPSPSGNEPPKSRPPIMAIFSLPESSDELGKGPEENPSEGLTHFRVSNEEDKVDNKRYPVPSNRLPTPGEVNYKPPISSEFESSEEIDANIEIDDKLTKEILPDTSISDRLPIEPHSIQPYREESSPHIPENRQPNEERKVETNQRLSSRSGSRYQSESRTNDNDSRSPQGNSRSQRHSSRYGQQNTRAAPNSDRGNETPTRTGINPYLQRSNSRYQAENSDLEYSPERIQLTDDTPRRQQVIPNSAPTRKRSRLQPDAEELPTRTPHRGRSSQRTGSRYQPATEAPTRLPNPSRTVERSRSRYTEEPQHFEDISSTESSEEALRYQPEDIDRPVDQVRVVQRPRRPSEPFSHPANEIVNNPRARHQPEEIERPPDRVRVVQRTRSRQQPTPKVAEKLVEVRPTQVVRTRDHTGLASDSIYGNGGRQSSHTRTNPNEDTPPPYYPSTPVSRRTVRGQPEQLSPRSAPTRERASAQRYPAVDTDQQFHRSRPQYDGTPYVDDSNSEQSDFIPEYERSPRTERRKPTTRSSARHQNTEIPSRQRSTHRQHQEPSGGRQNEPSSRGSSSNFRCPEPFGFFPDQHQCDKYYECRNGTAVESLCNDGLVFNLISSPTYLRCDSLRDVDCARRPELQEAQSTKHCPRRFGLFPHEKECTKFWQCVDGSSTEIQCPPGLVYDDSKGTCNWADLVKDSCSTEDLLGFKCPEPTGAEQLQEGIYLRYAHPEDCKLHFTCIKGADGQRRPRMLSCNDGMVFDPQTDQCTRPENVAGCEEYYGPIRRTPPPEKEEPIEQPVSRTSRRRRPNQRSRT